MIPKDKPIVTLTQREIRDIETKARQRQVNREYFIREKWNPWKSAAAEGGYILDKAFVRHEAQQTWMATITHVKPNMRLYAGFLGIVVAPMVLIGLWAESTRAEFDGRCRRGEIAYRDRYNKFVY